MKRAFTLFELVVVVVVIAILSFFITPRFNNSDLYKAADQIISHIRYTQHLAMIDNRFDPFKQHWYYERWRISFRDCYGVSTKKYYVIYKDMNHGGASAAPGRLESAIDPKDKKYLYNNGRCKKSKIDSSEVLIGLKYGIIDFKHKGGCKNSYIAFDNFGRPYYSTYEKEPFSGYFQSDCNLTFFTASGSFTITIYKETGYARLSDISN